MSSDIEISSEQGVSQFWRGNMPNIYKSWIQLGLKIFMYDKVKNAMMPYDTKKYKGFDYFWRTAFAASFCMGLTTLLSYPLDLFHTRITCDLAKKGQQRLFTTTFDCFNRTHLDEGRFGLFKGVETAIVSAILRGAFTLPIYDLFKRQSEGKS